MEIGKNGNGEKSNIVQVQSVPILSLSAGESNDQKDELDKKNRRVSFASSSQLAQFLEPINPFDNLAPISSSQELSNLYRDSCARHGTTPVASILESVHSWIDSHRSAVRTESLNLKNETLSHNSCEALEELFKRVKFKSIDLTACSLDDVSATAIFDMIEYYEACNELNISENPNIKNRGWSSCINMIKRTQALHSLYTRGTPLSDANALALGNALLSSYIYTLKLENCGLSGRPILCLSGALQKNKTLKELCLAANDLNHNDAFHISSVLKNNYHLQLLDISNNDIQDEGFRHLAEALGYQSVQVSRTSESGDSISSASKFDFSDLTTNLNNINNNRQRFCPTPPPKIQVADDGACSINNNSILQCDKEEEAAAAIDQSTKDEEKDEKFTYTTASLSPISHGYDDTTTNHQLFNVRSPERSFSSESLCSETSIESNDSKSSIRLIETKFKNGTLERHNPRATPDIGQNPTTGLQVFILWNNNLTSKCAASAADMLEAVEHLQIINFGQNPVGNQFLSEVKSSLKINRSLSSLGLQATQLTCDGLKMLAEALQIGGNNTLQRIDLRNNKLSMDGLTALNEALKSNKNIIRVDLDMSEDCQQIISTIKQQCALNENPQEETQEDQPKATTTVQRIKRNLVTQRKISLTCPSGVKMPPKQLLKPSTSPIRSPTPSPLPSPSRNRFHVSRVSESSSSGVSSKMTSSTSPSPSSSSGSPTFFPSNSRFRVVTVSETVAKVPVSAPPMITSQSAPAKTNFLDPIMNPTTLLTSQSCEQLDYEVKKFVDIDSCSSFSSSIESIDRQTDLSSTESFDLVEKSEPIVKIEEPGIENLKIEEPENENTLISTSSSSSSNEGLTLTTNSPTSELSPSQKRVRKTSWIQNVGETYPATLDKLLNLFHHPTSIFTKTSPDSTVSVSPKKELTSEKPVTGMGQKENSISGFLHSLVSLGHKKETSSNDVLQNISPENTLGKTSPVMTLETLPKSVQQELKENISPENTISSENLRQHTSKVLFVVGDDGESSGLDSSLGEGGKTEVDENQQ